MKCMAGCVQGTKHMKFNIPCQDRVFYTNKKGTAVIALADGAGSQVYHHTGIGADLLTQSICNFLYEEFDRLYLLKEGDLVRQIVQYCHRMLESKAKDMGVDSISHFSATLLFVAIKNGHVLAGQIGDGCIGQMDSMGMKVLSAPQNGEYVGKTYFITMKEAERFLNVFRFPIGDVQAFVLMSDGATDSLLVDDTQTFVNATIKLAKFINADDRSPAETEKVLHQSLFDYIVSQSGNSDDCSFAVIAMKDITTPLSDMTSDTIHSDGADLDPFDYPLPPRHGNGGSGIDVIPPGPNVQPVPNVPQSQRDLPRKMIQYPNRNATRKRKIDILAVFVIFLLLANIVLIIRSDVRSKREDKSLQTEIRSLGDSMEKDINSSLIQHDIELQAEIQQIKGRLTVLENGGNTSFASYYLETVRLSKRLEEMQSIIDHMLAVAELAGATSKAAIEDPRVTSRAAIEGPSATSKAAIESPRATTK